MNTFRWRLSACPAIIALLAATAAATVNIETVPVRNPGNAPDTRYASPGYGAVSYDYRIGKYEVTAGQYCDFLNKVAATDAYGLYNTGMVSTQYGCGISRGGSPGSYTYTVDSTFVNRPVNLVSYWDACRFANWLHNGTPSGTQGAFTTETGAYTLTTDGMSNNTVTRNPGWKWAVTSENEWYKAAYYDPSKLGGAGYWNYPTRSNTAPGQDMADTSGNNANCYTAPYSYPIDSGRYTTVVGEFQKSTNAYGTFDQGGNVYEWNEAIISGAGSFRCLRGGSYFHDDELLQASFRFESGYVPTKEYSWLGFRVAQVPEPATVTLLALGGLMLLSAPAVRRS